MWGASLYVDDVTRMQQRLIASVTSLNEHRSVGSTRSRARAYRDRAPATSQAGAAAVARRPGPAGPARAVPAGGASTVLLLLHGLPWWRLVLAPQWPAAVTIAGTVLAVVALIGFPFAMVNGHGRRASDRWPRIGDSWLGIVWVLFSWTVIGELADLALLLAGVPSPERQRILVAVSVLVVATGAVLLGQLSGAPGPAGPAHRDHPGPTGRRA